VREPFQMSSPGRGAGVGEGPWVGAGGGGVGEGAVVGVAVGGTGPGVGVSTPGVVAGVGTVGSGSLPLQAERATRRPARAPTRRALLATRPPNCFSITIKSNVAINYPMRMGWLIKETHGKRLPQGRRAGFRAEGRYYSLETRAARRRFWRSALPEWMAPFLAARSRAE
jgi:hypothetical protein